MHCVTARGNPRLHQRQLRAGVFPGDAGQGPSRSDGVRRRRLVPAPRGAPGRGGQEAMKLPPFEYAAPATLAEAITLLASGAGGAKAIAGGQSFLPVMAFRLASPKLLVDLRRIPGLDRIDIDGE